MFGLPDAKLRWQIARSPAAPGGVEIIEVSDAGGTALARKFDDVGAATLVATVRDLDATRARLARLGAPVVTRGGEPITGASKARSLVVKDPAGHFVQLVELPQGAATTAPAEANVVGVAVLLTVADIRQSMRLYGDALGLRCCEARPCRRARGFPRCSTWPPSRPRSLRCKCRRPASSCSSCSSRTRGRVAGKIQDPGSTRMQLRVNDIEEAIAAFKRFGGEVRLDGRRAARSAGRQLVAEGRDRARPEQFVRRADPGTAAGGVAR